MSIETKLRKPWKSWLLNIGLFVSVLLLVQWWQAKELPQGLAPPLLGVSSKGQPIALQNLRGKPVLVAFWATWCPICRLEEGSIANIAEDYQVLTVATTSGSAEEIETYLKQQELVMPVLMDDSGDLARSWGVSGVPATFIVDSKGHISYATQGYSSEIGLRLRLAFTD